MQINLISALALSLLYNFTFFKNVVSAYASEMGTLLPVCSIFIIQAAVTYILLTVVATGPWQKTVLGFLFFLSASIAYVTDTFGTIVDRVMILNIANTDVKESLDLITLKFVMYLTFLGVIPCLILFKVKPQVMSVKGYFFSVLKNTGGTILVIFILLFSFSKFYASFFREHKPLRYYSNPVFALYSLGSYLADDSGGASVVPEVIGKGSRIAPADLRRDLVIFVLGETARAENFSLNGYAKETNPLLKKEGVFSFSNVYSCGTSTATSVPCMFSIFGREAFTHKKSVNTENLVDVLYNTNQVEVLWRDNNSDSKGVAIRVPYENYKTSDKNKICDPECRDIGMLDGLQDYIDKSKKQDIFIVLHQMGNHGPAYYKRYPKEFEKFKPACHSAELGQCTQAQIVNAYDNAILYTDYFLSKVIELLKHNDHRFETAMVYVSDHGESLGENGIYLHGLPYSIAPDEQKKVASVFWFGKGMRDEIDIPVVKSRVDQLFSHDDIFHTFLGLFEIESSLYDKKKDMLH